jgi:hypothetical protein
MEKERMMTDLPEKKSDAVTPPDTRLPWLRPTLESLALKDALTCTFANPGDNMASGS